MMKRIVILFKSTEDYSSAQQLAKNLRLPLLETITDEYDYALVIKDNRLELQPLKDKLNSIYVDFLSQTVTYRRQQGGGRQQLIARACGLKSKYFPSIIDATAGLGEDAFVLACLGCQVTLLERSLILHALLQNGFTRASNDDFFKQLKMQLINIDAVNFLKQLNPQHYPDIIYLDPMFPTRSKSALVKKEMRILRDIVGEDMDASALLAIALQRALKRVVVKRPRLAVTIPGKEPDLTYKGKSCRFDVYLIKDKSLG